MNPKSHEMVDHINHDTLDNRKCNLRVVSPSQNQWNRIKRRNGSSRFKGVYRHPQTGRWMARIRCKRQEIYLGLYQSEEDAAKAYDAASRRLHGNYGLVNNI